MPHFNSGSSEGSAFFSKGALIRFLLCVLVIPVLFSGCASLDEFMSALDSDSDDVVYVERRPNPGYFDPYYNQPKIVYYQPQQQYYESKSSKTKGNKVFKTTTVRNEFGQTVYKNTTEHSKKKKKK